MSIGGWLGDEHEWKRLETSWQNCIDRNNFNNRPDQQISRFHATYMNRYEREFLNWTPELSARFANKLVGFLGRRVMLAVTIGADMDALKDVFPRGDPKRKDYAYTLCIKTAMVELAHLMKEYFPGDQVHLVHDHGNWDHQALAGYNLMVNDLEWEHRGIFVGITSLTGLQSVGLQAADLIAFEAHRALYSKLVHDSNTLRKAMQSLFAKGVAIVGRYMDKEAVIGLREVMAESGKYPNLDEGSIL
ncbi:MAG TPA: hypothetical protein VK638_45990 [Edaphobacter sp.]|nr:hypothetical protein [Edaphobacter sp.]